jgi:peptide/nickel transport system ATP-binding protein
MAPLLQIEDLHTEIRLRSATVYALDGVSLLSSPANASASWASPAAGKTMTALSIMQPAAAGRARSPAARSSWTAR